jgi:hypothetical protein
MSPASAGGMNFGSWTPFSVGRCMHKSDGKTIDPNVEMRLSNRGPTYWLMGYILFKRIGTNQPGSYSMCPGAPWPPAVEGAFAARRRQAKCIRRGWRKRRRGAPSTHPLTLYTGNCTHPLTRIAPPFDATVTRIDPSAEAAVDEARSPPKARDEAPGAPLH